MSDPGTVHARTEGHILIIEVDRQQKRNALTPMLIEDLARALTRLEDNADLWVGVVTFAGDHMTAGLDLPLDRVAVEYNRRIAARTVWEATELLPGDQLEIVQFVGGG